MKYVFIINPAAGKQKLQKELVYPVILLFMSMTGLFLFDRYGLNSIVSLLKQFNTGTGSFGLFRNMLRFMVYVLYFGFIVLSLLFLYFKKPKRIVMLYVMLCRFKTFNTVKSYYSAELISMMLICRKAGFHTRETLDILRSLSSCPVTAFLSFHLNYLKHQLLHLKKIPKQIITKPIFSFSFYTSYI